MAYTRRIRMTMLAALALAALASAASAQQRTYYDAHGNRIGTTTTDSQGSTTLRDASGRTTGRTSTDSQGTTTIYDARGRNVWQLPHTHNSARSTMQAQQFIVLLHKLYSSRICDLLPSSRPPTILTQGSHGWRRLINAVHLEGDSRPA
jgi:YD repeat-containing protein